jgi:hypothetical protein
MKRTIRNWAFTLYFNFLNSSPLADYSSRLLRKIGEYLLRQRLQSPLGNPQAMLRRDSHQRCTATPKNSLQCMNSTIGRNIEEQFSSQDLRNFHLDGLHLLGNNRSFADTPALGITRSTIAIVRASAMTGSIVPARFELGLGYLFQRAVAALLLNWSSHDSEFSLILVIVAAKILIQIEYKRIIDLLRIVVVDRL